MQGKARATALRIALVYALFGGLWILGSDWLLGRIVHDASWLVVAGAIKGWAFVAVTALALYAVVRRLSTPRPDAVGDSVEGGGSMARSTLLWLVSAVIVALTALALVYNQREHVARQAAQLEAVAELRATQVDAWMRDRLSQARFARGSTLWATLGKRWREQGDVAARDLLLERVVDLRKAFGADSALIVDEQGHVVAGGPRSTSRCCPSFGVPFCVDWPAARWSSPFCTPWPVVRALPSGWTWWPLWSLAAGPPSWRWSFA